MRHVAARLLDVSLSGCLIETEQPLRVGTPGTLHVDLWGVSCRYPVRVTRVAAGGERPGRVRLAAEFAWGEDHLRREPSARDRRGPARVLAFDAGRRRGADRPRLG